MPEQNKDKSKNKKRQCHFCVDNVADVDYKDVQLLRRYISSFGKIVARKRSGVCQRHQRMLGNAIKRARIMALLPFVQK